ncbi:MAG: hypothetical protein ED557_11900 [Balneola sp.]|nr:MAG: hypothetical protein ED557_11900 [Balneola sp.]
MKTLRQTYLLTLLLFVLLANNASAQGQVPITLTVPEGVATSDDRIELRTSNDGASFTTIAATLERQQDGSWTGSFTPGNRPFEYKYYIISSTGVEEPEGWANRKYYPKQKRERFNDVLHFMGGPLLTKNTIITIRLNVNQLSLNGEAPDAVGVMGSYGDLSWNVPDGVTHLQDQGNGIWEAAVNFPAGTTADFPIKFVWEYEGVWRWEYLPGFVDHLLVLDPEASTYTAEFSYNPSTGRVEVVQGTGLQVNNYTAAAETYGGTRNYEYYRAMELIDQGDYFGAQAMYARYRSHYRETFNDDFHGYLSRVLNSNGQTELALSIVEDWYNKAPDPYRKAHYRYLKGSVLMNSGRRAESRQAMQEVLTLAPEYDQEAIRGHALQSIGYSYLKEEDPSEVLKAREALNQLIEEHPNEQMRRVGWEYLVQAGEKGRSKNVLRRAMNGLKDTGTSSQKQRTRIRWVEMRLEDEELMDSTFTDDLEWLEWTVNDPERRDRVRLLKADWQIKQGLRQQAMETLLEVEGGGKTGANADRARIKLRELDAEWEQKRRRGDRNRNSRSTSADSTGGNQ